MKSVIKCLNDHAGVGQWAASLVAIIAIVIATRIGVAQNKIGRAQAEIGKVQNTINSRLLELEDSVEVFTVIGYASPASQYPEWLRVTNVGNLQVYLEGYSMDGALTATDNYLIPAGQQQSAWFSIPLGLSKAEVASSTLNKKIELLLVDELNRHWVSKIEVNRNAGWGTYVEEIKERS